MLVFFAISPSLLMLFIIALPTTGMGACFMNLAALDRLAWTDIDDPVTSYIPHRTTSFLFQTVTE